MQALDMRGLKCPLPVLKLEKILAGGAELPFVLLADDPVARIDIPLACKKAGLNCVLEDAGGYFRFEINAPEN